jgi:hypothetical protein
MVPKQFFLTKGIVSWLWLRAWCLTLSIPHTRRLNLRPSRSWDSSG